MHAPCSTLLAWISSGEEDCSISLMRSSVSRISWLSFASTFPFETFASDQSRLARLLRIASSSVGAASARDAASIDLSSATWQPSFRFRRCTVDFEHPIISAMARTLMSDA